MIKVLIVEDSRTISQHLEYLLGSDADIQVVGNVANGKEAVDFIKGTMPDIISMDIDMPVMNGLDATRIIMSTTPVPILIVTASRNAKKSHMSFDALSAGALSVIEKPIGINHPEENRLIKNFLTLIKTYSKVKVIKRNSIKNKIDKEEKKTTIGLSNNYISSKICDNKKYVAIGVSTGGPKVLKTIFSNITNSFPCAIIVVQHITPGFMENMITWLNNFTSIPISIAKHNEELKSGHIYFAPDNFQIGVSNNFIHLSKNIEELKFCPSIDHLFYSLANKNGYETIGILLTGMGDDGARGLKKLKDNGAETIVQDKESSMIFGMPNEAIKLGAEKHILNPEQFSEFLRNSENK